MFCQYLDRMPAESQRKATGTAIVSIGSSEELVVMQIGVGDQTLQIRDDSIRHLGPVEALGPLAGGVLPHLPDDDFVHPVDVVGASLQGREPLLLG
jgi:hypothetical protein